MKSINITIVAAAVLAAVISGGAFAAAEHHGAATPVASASALTAGEVRKVDVEQGKVTIRHEPIANLDMPAMTMVFRAEQPKVLQGLKPGDKVRFQAESARGTLFVTRIELAK